jgi:large subunit ribosomal protein L28
LESEPSWYSLSYLLSFNIQVESIMTKICQITGRKRTRGYTYVTRGIAKKKKGIGIKVTGRTKRSFLPNLQEKRIWVPEENKFITLRLSCAAMRTIEKNGLSSVIRSLQKKGMVA